MILAQLYVQVGPATEKAQAATAATRDNFWFQFAFVALLVLALLLVNFLALARWPEASPTPKIVIALPMFIGPLVGPVGRALFYAVQAEPPAWFFWVAILGFAAWVVTALIAKQTIRAYAKSEKEAVWDEAASRARIPRPAAPLPRGAGTKSGPSGPALRPAKPLQKRPPKP